MFTNILGVLLKILNLLLLLERSAISDRGYSDYLIENTKLRRKLFKIDISFSYVASTQTCLNWDTLHMYTTNGLFSRLTYQEKVRIVFTVIKRCSKTH